MLKHQCIGAEIFLASTLLLSSLVSGVYNTIKEMIAKFRTRWTLVCRRNRMLNKWTYYNDTDSSGSMVLVESVVKLAVLKKLATKQIRGKLV